MELDAQARLTSGARREVLGAGQNLQRVVFLPLLLPVGRIVILDVGAPIVFWHQRLGGRGCKFLLYKFRTLRPAFRLAREGPSDETVVGARRMEVLFPKEEPP
jgi:lipopolysaccharide/colanic/teichoic acid biosynthesis glycosyltransferase